MGAHAGRWRTGICHGCGCSRRPEVASASATACHGRCAACEGARMRRDGGGRGRGHPLTGWLPGQAKCRRLVGAVKQGRHDRLCLAVLLRSRRHTGLGRAWRCDRERPGVFDQRVEGQSPQHAERELDRRQRWCWHLRARHRGQGARRGLSFRPPWLKTAPWHSGGF